MSRRMASSDAASETGLRLRMIACDPDALVSLRNGQDVNQHLLHSRSPRSYRSALPRPSASTGSGPDFARLMFCLAPPRS